MEEQKIDKRTKAYRDHGATTEKVYSPYTNSEMKTALVDAYNKNTKNIADIGEKETREFFGVNTPVEYNPNGSLETLILHGIPVSKADFHTAVNNGQDVPENSFNAASDNKRRRVQMWLVAGGSFMLCFHNNKYFGVPSSNIKFWNFK